MGKNMRLFVAIELSEDSLMRSDSVQGKMVYKEIYLI